MHVPSCAHRFPLFRLLVTTVAILTALAAAPSVAHAESSVVLATYDGVINPVSAEYLHDALASAQEDKAQALIFRLNTPGGLDTSMRLIIKDITSSTIPVIVYVSPSSGRAASAGVFITMAAHVAAMAPGTNIGAAHPVAMGGDKMDEEMKKKVENDSVAYITSIAQQRGRNVAWAEDAVRKSVSVTEREALKLKIIDVVADDVPALLKQLDGRTVGLQSGQTVLHTAGTILREFPMGPRLEFLKILSDPNIAYLLMTIGTIGIIAELYSPGAILPGVVGAISLILAFYSFQSLPVNYAGILLFLLGIALFILEANVTSYGLLAIGGVVAMLLGSVMLIKTDVEFLQISWSVILPVVTLATLFSLFVVGMGVKAMRRRADDRTRRNGRPRGDCQNGAGAPRTIRGPWRTLGGRQRATASARRRSGSHRRGRSALTRETPSQTERGPIMMFISFAIAILAVSLILLGFHVLREYERAVIFRWGRLTRGLVGGNGPGVVIIIPFIDRMVRVSLRTVTMDVPPQDVITKDNVTVKVNAVIYFRVVDQERAIIQVEDYLYATSMMSQTTLRSILGQSQLDDLLSKREQINAELQRIIDQQTEPWGVKVTAVEVKNVDLPQEMQRAIARQAEAERERRAKVIHAQGEFEASQRLADAADVISRNPAALQLRYLQTLVEISADKNSTTIFPIPIDTIAPFLKYWGKQAEP